MPRGELSPDTLFPAWSRRGENVPRPPLPGDTATIPGVSGAEAYSDPKKDEQGYVHVIAIGVKADIVFVVSLGEHADSVDLGLPDRLMQQQYNKL